ncbi:MAG: Uncharacterized protein FD147_49 [Chloroflexi bacterium]|nr:MAG: Uncharacterized protein FD147_49 [Chloroflexota bacterium]MBA4374676.1 hypothetical protein [Anaerolinea sp.]
MQPKNEQNDNEVNAGINRIEKVLLFLLVLLALVLLIVIIFMNNEQILRTLFPGRIYSFDEMIVTNGFHDIQLENGQSWRLSYEQSHDTNFSGIVRHTSPIELSTFSILTRDILVTSGDFADPNLVTTSVSNHRFLWKSLSSANPEGSINLLHTVPMNEEINQKLKDIHNGDTITIKGWDIYRIEGWDSNGNYIGYWQDSGCNTTLVTEVIITKNSGK